MAFYYLLLGHLLGDFVFQTNRIAENKGNSWRWTVLHVSIVTLCMLMLSFGYGIELVLLILANGCVHFLLDFFKLRIAEKLGLKQITAFLLDQALHILIIYIISILIKNKGENLLDLEAVKLFLLLVLVTSVAAVLTQMIISTIYPRDGFRFFEDGEKQIGILTRIFITLVLYLTFMISPFFALFLLLVPVAFSIQYKLKWSKWMAPSQLIMKVVFDASISAAATVIILFLSNIR